MAILISAETKIAKGKERADWENTYSALRPLLDNVPQIKSGAVEVSQAELWLEAASKSLKAAFVSRLINELDQFNSEDARALWAHDHDEYYPKYEAVEVYRQKTMTAFRIPESDDMVKFYLTNMIYEEFRKKESLRTLSLSNGQGSKTTKQSLPWISQKGMFILESTSGKGAPSIYDFKINYNSRLTLSDEVRHHFYHLAAGNRGINTKDSFQVNVIIPAHVLETVKDLIEQGGSSFSLAQQLVSSAVDNGQVKFEQDKVLLGSPTFNKIINSGNMHMNNIQNKIMPEFRSAKKDKTPLDANQKEQVITAAKEYTVARHVLEAAQERFDDVKTRLPQLMRKFEIHGDYENPYPLAKVGGNRPFDLDRATQALLQLNVPQHLFSDNKYDVAGMVEAMRAAGMNTNQFVEGFTPEKTKVIDLLTMNGIDPEQFKVSGVHTHRSGQTRGDLATISKEIQIAAKQALENTYQAIASNPVIDKPIAMTEHKPTAQNHIKAGI